MPLNQDEDDISIFVQEIDARKPLIGRAREYSLAHPNSPLPPHFRSSSRPQSLSRPHSRSRPDSRSARTRTREAEEDGESRSRSPALDPPTGTRGREPLGMLPGIGLGLAGISNWYDDEDGHNNNNVDEGGEGPRFAGRYAPPTLSPNTTPGLGERKSPLSPTHIPTSSSPAVSPTLLQYRYQQQQQWRERDKPSISTSSPTSTNLGVLALIASRSPAHGGVPTSPPSQPPQSPFPPTTSPPHLQRRRSTTAATMARTQDPTTTAAATNPPPLPQYPYELSTSPTSPARGPMLTSQEEVGERLRKMNEVFLKSLEGISLGSGERERRRRRERERELEREREQEQEREREYGRRENVVEPMERLLAGKGKAREVQQEEEEEEGVTRDDREEPRDWGLERERERRYYYGYDERAGLGLGLPSLTQPRVHTDLDGPGGHNYDDDVTSPNIPLPSPLSTTRTASPTTFPSALHPFRTLHGRSKSSSASPSSPSPTSNNTYTYPTAATTGGGLGHHTRGRTGGYTPSSTDFDRASSPSPSSPSTRPNIHRRTSTNTSSNGGGNASLYSQGSEEVLGRMEVDMSMPSVYDRERDRERQYGIGNNRFRRY